jgi:hypothetical protein
MAHAALLALLTQATNLTVTCSAAVHSVIQTTLQVGTYCLKGAALINHIAAIINHNNAAIISY